MATTVTKRELVQRISERLGHPKLATKEIVQAFLDEIVAELGAGNRLEFRDFGVFEVRVRAARQARNPQTKEPVEIPPKYAVRFKVGRVMKKAVDALPERQARNPEGPPPRSEKG